MSIWTELRGIVRAWWCGDRIRVSPREGRLLRMQPGDVVTVRGVAAEILARQEWIDAIHPGVDYQCRTACGEARLTVALRDERGGMLIVWRDSACRSDTAADAPPVEIDETEVNDFPRRT